MIVLDASLGAKTFLEEQDSPIVRREIASRFLQKQDFIAPDLFRYEMYLAAFGNGIDPALVDAALRDFTIAGLRIIAPSVLIMEQAFEIARIGNKKQGWPSLQDSLYHALALELGATFWTADQRHFAKTKHLGAIELFQANNQP